VKKQYYKSYIIYFFSLWNDLFYLCCCFHTLKFCIILKLHTHAEFGFISYLPAYDSMIRQHHTHIITPLHNLQYLHRMCLTWYVITRQQHTHTHTHTHTPTPHPHPQTQLLRWRSRRKFSSYIQVITEFRFVYIFLQIFHVLLNPRLPQIWTKIHNTHFSFILWYTSVVPSHLCLHLPRNLSPSGSWTQTCMYLPSVMYTTCSCHLNLLHLISLIISDQVYKS